MHSSFPKKICFSLLSVSLSFQPLYAVEQVVPYNPIETTQASAPPAEQPQQNGAQSSTPEDSGYEHFLDGGSPLSKAEPERTPEVFTDSLDAAQKERLQAAVASALNRNTYYQVLDVKTNLYVQVLWSEALLSALGTRGRDAEVPVKEERVPDKTETAGIPSVPVIAGQEKPPVEAPHGNATAGESPERAEEEIEVQPPVIPSAGQVEETVPPPAEPETPPEPREDETSEQPPVVTEPAPADLEPNGENPAEVPEEIEPPVKIMGLIIDTPPVKENEIVTQVPPDAQVVETGAYQEAWNRAAQQIFEYLNQYAKKWAEQHQTDAASGDAKNEILNSFLNFIAEASENAAENLRKLYLPEYGTKKSARRDEAEEILKPAVVSHAAARTENAVPPEVIQKMETVLGSPESIRALSEAISRTSDPDVLAALNAMLGQDLEWNLKGKRSPYMALLIEMVRKQYWQNVAAAIRNQRAMVNRREKREELEKLIRVILLGKPFLSTGMISFYDSQPIPGGGNETAPASNKAVPKA